MTLIELKDQMLFVVSQSVGTTVPRLLAVLIGLLLCLAVMQAIWERRSVRMRSALFLFAGFVLLASGVFPGFLHGLVRVTDPIRLRVLVGVLSAGVLLVTFESIRRSLLRERYALLWMVTGLSLFLSALIPQSVDLIGAVFGTDYWVTVVGILAAFILFTTFHFSLAFSKHEQNQQKLAQRCAALESRIERMEKGAGSALMYAVPSVVSREHAVEAQEPSMMSRFHLKIPGAYLLLLVVIVSSVVVSLVVGLRTREPMLGDEVTHFYMLANQADDLTRPAFEARIPVGWGDDEVRRYPHVNAWHYIGAIFYRLTGRSFAGVQIYQTLFWLQFLLAAGWLARRRNRKISRVPVLYVLLLATIPAVNIFSVAHYQDIPAAAQILLAFAMAYYGHWITGAIFMLLALSFKVTSFIFVPAFLVVILLNGYKGWRGLSRVAMVKQAVWRCCVVTLLLACCSFAWDFVLRENIGARFYPFETVSRTVKSWNEFLRAPSAAADDAFAGSQPDARADVARVTRPALVVTPYEKEIIANHPGDLRIPKNYLIYGGGVLWIVLLLGVGWRVCEVAFRKRPEEVPSGVGLLLTGLSYVLPTAYLLRTAPDARFFLPAIPFLLLPVVEWVGRSPKIRLIASVLGAMAILQAGHVYAKIYELRSVDPELKAAIAYLVASPPKPARVFMYPEGNYRLFPVKHDWYLNYWLRDFWQGDNDFRLQILHQERIGAIVVKKHLIGVPDAAYTDLGIYPVAFVEDITADPRFENVFENGRIVIFTVPRME
jgi:hypothetical protein